MGFCGGEYFHKSITSVRGPLAVLISEGSENMNHSRSHHLTYWLLGVTIVLAFGFGDIAAIALAAAAVSSGLLAALSVAFMLIAGGALFTVWRFE
jgi:hypothetical protein